MCANCGVVYEPGEAGLVRFSPLTAAVTSGLAVAGPVRYLAVWRVSATIETGLNSAWDRVRRAAAPGPAYVYVPAFTLIRPVIQRLGVRLTEAQPALELNAGLADSVRAWTGPRGIHAADEKTRTTSARGDVVPGISAEPDFGAVSPIVLGRSDAGPLAHFVFLAVESYETKDLRSVDYKLEPSGTELLFVPAVWDPRHIHESNWRLLLREFDGLVA